MAKYELKDFKKWLAKNPERSNGLSWQGLSYLSSRPWVWERFCQSPHGGYVESFNEEQVNTFLKWKAEVDQQRERERERESKMRRNQLTW